MIEIKKKLLDHCLNFLNQRIEAAQEAIRVAQESANDETKSSAGDKYETGRAMAQLEMEKYGLQLAEAFKQHESLKRIDITKTSDKAQLGSLIFTEGESFFMAISVGIMNADGQSVAIISPTTPIGKALIGKAVGDTVVFSGRRLTISKIR